MAKLLNILANHQLNFSSGIGLVNAFEQATNQKIGHWNFKTDKPLSKTSKIDKVNFWTNKDAIAYNFAQWKQLRIFTNYEYCDEITLYKNTIKFHSTGYNSKYSKWQKTFFDEYLDEKVSAYEVEIFQQKWEEMRIFVKRITHQLKGYKIIYFDDNRFQSQQDVYYEGGTIDELIVEMTKIWPPTAYDNVRKFRDNHITKYGWYFEYIQ